MKRIRFWKNAASGHGFALRKSGIIGQSALLMADITSLMGMDIMNLYSILYKKSDT
jgi:hypothetical protein